MNPGPAPAPTAVVGHVEWVTHAEGSLPARGCIADLAHPLAEAAGGGSVAAAAIARSAAPAILFTALGNDDAARRCAEALHRPGLQVVAATRDAPQTPVLSVTEGDGERTIMVVGPRLQPRAADPIDWDLIGDCAACYYAGEDPGALLRARAAPMLVITARRLADARDAGVRADVIVGSAHDPQEDPSGLPAALEPEWTVLTQGAAGGVVRHRGGDRTRYAPQAPPGPVVDTYGCGDTFAGCLAAHLGAGADIGHAVARAAAEAARCATWRGGPGPTA